MGLINKIKTTAKKVTALSLIVLVVLLATRLDLMTAHAAALTAISDTLSNASVSTASNHTIVFTSPSGVASGGTITITLPGSFNASAVSFTDVDILDGASNLPVAATPSGSTWGFATTSATSMTFTNGTTVISPGHVITIKIGTNATLGATGVNQIINDSSTGTKSISIAGSFGDTGTATVVLVSNSTVAVSATVSQSIAFSISSNAISFGTLSSSAPQYANTSTGSASDTVAHTLAVSTNGSTGYTITVQGSTLTSLQNSADTIAAIGASPAVSSPGTDQFGIYATKSGGVNGTIATPYATASSFGYNATATTSATFASGTTPTATETYSLHYLANIIATRSAGTYSTSLVYVATANF